MGCSNNIFLLGWLSVAGIWATPRFFATFPAKFERGVILSLQSAGAWTIRLLILFLLNRVGDLD